MNNILYQVIVSCSDGSNALEYTKNLAVVSHWQKLADSGEETYASGDGLQLRVLKFKTEEALNDFIELNCMYSYVSEVEEE